MRRSHRLVAVVGGAAWLVLVSAAPALAQVFDKFDERGRTEMPATPFVAGAYAFIWVALLVYVFLIARGLHRAEGEVAELKRRIAARTPGSAASGSPAQSAHPAGTIR